MRPARATSRPPLAHPRRNEIRLESVLDALADPIRLRIVHQLATGKGEFPYARFALPVAKSTATHHFRVLRDGGVIRQYYRGAAKMSILRCEDLDALYPGLLDSVVTAATRECGRRAINGGFRP
ncbi:helix-turn-helix transcriptional regulator [Streptomyces sp. NPDC050738]|uniref:ArsR/SmtB family transcription factor n=1 Tax=Streptomyces sp. NPDC050738 TaxID=3154744 RepID=UPI00343AC515